MSGIRQRARMHRLFWTTSELLAAGWSRSRISAASERGELVAVRKGHYAVPGAPPDLVRAVRVGGVATATTAGRALGLWTPMDDRLHVALPLTDDPHSVLDGSILRLDELDAVGEDA